MGAMERINSTPLPFAYVAHLRTFLVLYLLGLPIALYGSWGWATPVVRYIILPTWEIATCPIKGLEFPKTP
eukprot:CAMPEP_0204232722 /NCGR_PEP_ID=MMETSP0361-20130328/89646_1 /ASSEMBLY_ACC=CAM_ASM_000343 /TAXON_ID=268821 /ORGANISM="Scrippsiella Hangoei, Strain SHTV-5" /LENGTH=70 /DNA_ID=CAMNT_0051202777 /DNA_START=30 /DNA_END=242 /DNA_ORIENTATION=+